MSIAFDGSTCTFTPYSGNATALSPLTDFDFQDNAPEIDDSGSADSEITVITGWSDELTTIGFLGSKVGVLNVGSKGDLTVALNDGGDDGSYEDTILVELTVSGSLGQAIQSKAVFAAGSAIESAQPTALNGTPDADPIFDGTTVLWGGVSLGNCSSVTYTDSPAKVEVSGADDAVAKKKYGIGRPNRTVTVTVDGHPALAMGAKAALIVHWADDIDANGPGSMTKAVVSKRPHQGSRGGKITTTYTFRPSKT